MKHFIAICALLISTGTFATKTIHVYVALCDNANQGIVPVPAHLGNGQDAKSNLYWGAMYGVKTYFKRYAAEWELVISPSSNNPKVLERLVFYNAKQDAYLLAEAYDGRNIKSCIEDFLVASNGQGKATLKVNGKDLAFGGGADLVCYVGHDGLMEFDANVNLKDRVERKAAMMLACFSKQYFSPYIKKAGADPVLWTTHLMAPEAYTLRVAINGWLEGKTGVEIDELAAAEYHRMQKCGMKGARKLFTTGH